VQTIRLAEFFELLTASVALTRPENSYAKSCAIRLFWHEPLDLDWTRKC